MKVEHSDEELRGVEKILTKPVFIGFSEETIRVRRNLLTLAFITVIYKLSGNHIIEFSFFGIKFDTSPDKRFLDITILCLLVYHLAHFIWQSIDALKECKLRVTGTNVLFMKNDNRKTSDCDFATDPRQSSLLNWLWKQRYTNLISDITQAEKDLKDIRLKLNKNETATTIHQLEEKYNALRQYVVDL